MNEVPTTTTRRSPDDGAVSWSAAHPLAAPGPHGRPAETSGLDPRNLILEITEGTMLKDTDTTVCILEQLRNLGVRLAIDDFGTGYSSLSYLHKFPIDVLKIDKSFIDKLNKTHEGTAMARAIISMSDTLRLGTIAEGIESEEQSETLHGLGCDMGQGYLFAHPLGAAAMSVFLRDAGNGRHLNTDDQLIPPAAEAHKRSKVPAYR